MGLEYAHFLAPADPFREPSRDLVHRVHEALSELGVVDEPPTVTDCDGREPRKPGKKRGVLEGPPVPEEATYVWRPSEACGETIDACFGGGASWDGLFFEASLIAGPSVKVMRGVGWDGWIEVVGKARDYSERREDPHYDEARSSWVDWVFEPDARPEVQPVEIVSPLTGKKQTLPDDWFPGVFRACVIFDFSKTFPDFVQEEPHRVPARVSAALAEALGDDVRQAYQYF